MKVRSYISIYRFFVVGISFLILKIKFNHLEAILEAAGGHPGIWIQRSFIKVCSYISKYRFFGVGISFFMLKIKFDHLEAVLEAAGGHPGMDPEVIHQSMVIHFKILVFWGRHLISNVKNKI